MILGKCFISIGPAISGGDKSCYVEGCFYKGQIFIIKVIYNKEINNEIKKNQYT